MSSPERPLVQRLIILGTGGNALDVLDTVDAINRIEQTWEVAGFLDDSPRKAVSFLGLPVLGVLGDAVSHADCLFVSAIWNDRLYKSLHEVLARTGMAPDRFATLIHPRSVVSPRARLGRDVVIHHGVSIGGNATIEDHVWVGTGSIIGHDTTVSTCTTLAPGVLLGGGVHVERNCYVGSGALVRPLVCLGEGSLIGMGAVVLTKVGAGDTVVGNPAKSLASRRAAVPS